MKHSFLLTGFIAISLFLTSACSKSADDSPVSPVDPDPTPTPPVTTVNVVVTTIAGKVGDHGNAEDGNGTTARFWNPTKMIFDNRNNILYVADGTTIRAIDQQNNVTTYMPLHTISNFNEIQDISLAPGVGGTLYFTSKENDIWKIEPDGAGFKTTALINRIYGGNETGALNSNDQLDGTSGITVGKNGEIYFFNAYWNTMRKITLTSASSVSGTVEDFAGRSLTSRSGTAWPFQDGDGQTASFGGSVSDIAADGNGNIYVADFRNDLLRKVSPDGAVSSLFQYKNGFGIDVDGPVTSAQANRVTQVSPSLDGTAVFFTTFGTGGNNTPALRMVKPGKQVITLVESGITYGDGSGKTAGFSTIGGIAATADGKTIFLSEPGSKVIRKVTIT